MFQEEISTIPLEFKIIWKTHTNRQVAFFKVRLLFNNSALGQTNMLINLKPSKWSWVFFKFCLFQGKLKWGHAASKNVLVIYLKKQTKEQEYSEAN